jgi:hypothetical protein
MGAAAEFDSSGKLIDIVSGLCHNASTISHGVSVQNVYVHLRENCNEITNVYGGSTPKNANGNSAWPGAPYTNQLFAAQTTPPSGFPSYTEDTERTDLADKSLAPLGRSSPAGIMMDSNTDITKLEVPLSVYDSEYGSLRTSVQFGGCDPATDSTCTYLDLTGDKPQTAGHPLACEGYCKSGAANQNKGSTASTTGFKAVMNLFAYSWGTYAVVDTNKVATSTPIYTLQNPGVTDQRLTVSTEDDAPEIHPINPLNCSGDACEEKTADGITVTDSFGTSSDGTTNIKTPSGAEGKLKVTLKYYAFADSDRMPIRRKVVDFYGGINEGGDLSGVSVSTGYFKNHRGLTLQSGIYKATCGTSTTDWGLQPQACDGRYYEDTRTYFCNSTILDKLDACTSGAGNKSSFYPCSRNGNQCVYRPRVQFLDNWQLCNGSCPSGAGGSGDLCANSDFDDGFQATPDKDNECALKSESAPFEYWDDYNETATTKIEPWTWFGGEIIVDAPSS